MAQSARAAHFAASPAEVRNVDLQILSSAFLNGTVDCLFYGSRHLLAPLQQLIRSLSVLLLVERTVRQPCLGYVNAGCLLSDF